MYFEILILVLLLYGEFGSLAVSNGLLELAKKEILRRVKEMGYQLELDNVKINNIKMIYGDKSIYRIINYIPILNVIVNLKNTRIENLDNILNNLIERGVLVESTARKEEHMENFSNIQKIMPNKPNLLINNKRTSLGLALELKSKISEILNLDISDNEKNNKVIELLESYNIIPYEEKIKVKKLEK